MNIQGSGGSQDDLDNLHATLQMYEQVVDDYSQDYEDVWQRNLSTLASLANRPLEEMQEQEEESLLFGELPDLEEDTVPIIGVGGIDPVVAVQEDEESMILEEMEEEIEPPPEDEDEDELPIAPILAAPLPAAPEPARDGGGGIRWRLVTIGPPRSAVIRESTRSHVADRVSAADTALRSEREPRERPPFRFAADLAWRRAT